jgi:hypothetical protein
MARLPNRDRPLPCVDGGGAGGSSSVDGKTIWNAYITTTQAGFMGANYGNFYDAWWDALMKDPISSYYEVNITATDYTIHYTKTTVTGNGLQPFISYKLNYVSFFEKKFTFRFQMPEVNSGEGTDKPSGQGGNLLSVGISASIAYPEQIGGKGISLGVVFGNGAAFYATKKKGDGIMLSGALDVTVYKNMTKGKLNPYSVQGDAYEMDVGYSWFGSSFGWAGDDYYNAPYRTLTISGSYGMDYGAAEWESETIVLPLDLIVQPILSPIGIGIIWNFLTE